MTSDESDICRRAPSVPAGRPDPGHRDETSAPKIPAVRRGRCRIPALPHVARAQAYPSRPITMIVPLPAGGPTDVTGESWPSGCRRRSDNPSSSKTSAERTGSIGTGRVARARPDGYTIVLGNIGTHVLNGAFYSLPYDVLNDFAPISPLVTTPLVLFARKTMPAKDLQRIDRLAEGQSRQGVGRDRHRRHSKS